MKKSQISSCLIGIVLGAIIGGLAGVAFSFEWIATAALLGFVFFGYFLGAILDNLESLNIQIQHQRRGK